ncbi:MAG: SDR family oxidoreductase [Planctomycetales bacterium]|nr:SDR family oxidoreductase [Planctomycetales bacterium]
MPNLQDPRTVIELFDLTSRTALVTGGTGWLGRAISIALAEAGANVVVASRDSNRAQQASADLPVYRTSQCHYGVALDHMRKDSLHDGFEQARACTGQIHILVNNGIASVGQDLTAISFESFAQHQVNNAGYFELSRMVRDHAVERSQPASIINVGSMYGEVASYPEAYAGIAPASSVAYQTLKAGTIQLTRHLAVYWAADRVRVNCLSPGPFPNPGTAPAELMTRLESKVPLRRLGNPEELKGAVVFLASDASSYVTGLNLVVDGGWTVW